jgi:large subunit ribosomal protein L9
MKVILLEELKSQGGEGDVVEVTTGYAVNFLFPQKLAIPATPGNLKQLEQRKHNIAKREGERLDTADKLLEALEGKTIRIGAKVGEEGQLFGSVTASQVAEAVKARFGAEVDRKRIDLHGTIKTAGEHTATISIYREIKANITVEVVDENLLKAEAAAEAEGEAVAEVAAEVATEIEAEIEAEVIAEAIIEEAEETLKEAAQSIAAAADAAQENAEDAEAEALADAAVEVLKDIEATLDASTTDPEQN